MAKKVHRPLEGLTWPQLCLIRDVATGRSARYGRALVGLMGRKKPVLHFDGSRIRLSDEGKRIWSEMQAWRPDLYAESR